MRVVLALGGSVLAPELSADRIRTYANTIARLSGEGCELAVIVGGGGIAREYITAGREVGANEVELDQLGIGATRLNARLLIAALDEDAAATPATSYEEGYEAVKRGDIAVMGGVTPGQTTDAVAAALAEYIGADLLVYGTNIAGIFDADPSTDTDASRYERLTPSELIEVIAPMSRDAGASAPVDLLAAKLIERADMRAVVVDGTDPRTIERAVLEGDHEGTDIIPEATTEPSVWAGR